MFRWALLTGVLAVAMLFFAPPSAALDYSIPAELRIGSPAHGEAKGVQVGILLVDVLAISDADQTFDIERFSEEPDPLLEDAAEIMIAFFDAFLAEHPQGLEPALESMREHGHTAVVDLDGSEEPPSVQG